MYRFKSDAKRTSDAQRAANRKNAQASTGPKTPEAKHKTRMNAYRHGLTGQIQFFTDEDRAAFQLHCKGIVESLNPVGGMEQTLAQAIAENHWRLMRARAIENNIFGICHDGHFFHGVSYQEYPEHCPVDQAKAQAHAWDDKGPELHLLALYETRIQRSIERNMAELRTLRAERNAARKQALDEAQVLVQHAKTKNEPYDPAPDFPPEILQNGFDFSTGVITHLIDRNQRLHEARQPKKVVPAAA